MLELKLIHASERGPGMQLLGRDWYDHSAGEGLTPNLYITSVN